MTDALHNLLKQLRLSGLLSTLEVRLHEAAANHLDHREFLELILQDELAVRSDRQLQRRVKAAQFREVKALDQFDWSFNPNIPKKPIFELATCNFIRQHRDVLLLGPPGVEKAFWRRLGYHAIKAGFLVLYRSVFDLVRDFLHDELLGDGDKMLAKYPSRPVNYIPPMGGRVARGRGAAAMDFAGNVMHARCGLATEGIRVHARHLARERWAWRRWLAWPIASGEAATRPDDRRDALVDARTCRAGKRTCRCADACMSP